MRCKTPTKPCFVSPQSSLFSDESPAVESFTPSKIIKVSPQSSLFSDDMRHLPRESTIDRPAIEALLAMNQSVEESSSQIRATASDEDDPDYMESPSPTSSPVLKSDVDTEAYNVHKASDPGFSMSTLVYRPGNTSTANVTPKPKQMGVPRKKLTKKEQLEKKRAKNREAARTSRLRKLELIQSLEQQVKDLQTLLAEKDQYIANLMGKQ